MHSRLALPAAAAALLTALSCAPALEAGGGAPASTRTLPQGNGAPGGRGWIGAPLVLDSSDLRFGVSVHFTRVPTVSELHDLEMTSGLAHVVLSLPAWPEGVDEIQSLAQASPDVDVLVILSGYPPTRAAAQAWNLLPTRVRLVVIVDGPPTDRTLIGDLNQMRSLERVVAQMDSPERSGFERLQRPLSFRRVVE